MLSARVELHDFPFFSVKVIVVMSKRFVSLKAFPVFVFTITSLIDTVEISLSVESI